MWGWNDSWSPFRNIMGWVGTISVIFGIFYIIYSWYVLIIRKIRDKQRGRT